VPGAFELWAQTDRLEGLLHGYFSVAARSTGHVVRVRWRAGQPTLVLAGLSVPLIVMSAPTTESSGQRRAISVTVEGGLLVRPASAARLALTLEHRPPHTCARVELLDYAPRGGHWRIVRWLYGASQGRLHVFVGCRFLRELRRAWTDGPWWVLRDRPQPAHQ
jgi:hypothetical protein